MNILTLAQHIRSDSYLFHVLLDIFLTIGLSVELSTLQTVSGYQLQTRTSFAPKLQRPGLHILLTVYIGAAVQLEKYRQSSQTKTSPVILH